VRHAQGQFELAARGNLIAGRQGRRKGAEARGQVGRAEKKGVGRGQCRGRQGGKGGVEADSGDGALQGGLLGAQIINRWDRDQRQAQAVGQAGQRHAVGRIFERGVQPPGKEFLQALERIAVRR